MSFYFQDVWRMDWGLGNPNKTAALIATLMAGVWIFTHCRKWAFWIVVPLFAGLGICLLHTLSRGGVVAALAGLSVIAWTTPRPWLKWRVGAIALSVGVILASGWVFKAPKRITQSFGQEDKSVTHRLEIWGAAPGMMVDAPWGWGIGQAGEAYMQWYQPIGRQEGYRTLVNSHLTWLVEWGWAGRIGYVCGWGIVFVLLWPCAQAGWFGVPLGLWVSFFVAAAFSSVAESWPLWILPLTSLFAVLGVRWWRGVWPPRQIFLIWIGTAAAILGGLAVIGLLNRQTPRIRQRADSVIVIGNNPTPSIALISPAKEILGLHYGHAVRRALGEGIVVPGQSVAISRNAKIVPMVERMVFSGKLPQAFPWSSAKEIVLISPEKDDQLQNVSFDGATRLSLMVGEFSRRKSFWKRMVGGHPGWELREVPGTMDYMPKWEEVAFRAMASPDTTP